jgi:hypothetical protein
MPGSKMIRIGAWDIELGFKNGKLYLFRYARSWKTIRQNSEYLSTIDSDKLECRIIS